MMNAKKRLRSIAMGTGLIAAALVFWASKILTDPIRRTSI